MDEAAKRPFSHGDAETGKTTSFGDAEKWKLELVSVGFFYYYFYYVSPSGLEFISRSGLVGSHGHSSPFPFAP